MNSSRRLQRLSATLILAVSMLGATSVLAQVTGLFYQEVPKDGRIYVFNTVEKLKSFQASGDMGVAITMLGQGPNGETIVAENETALDLYDFKHDRQPYMRPAPKPAPPPAPPTVLKVGDGELKLGLLLQGWYATDDSPVNTATTSTYGNTTGLNTFRIRRAEIKLNGRITPAWGFEVMFDPAKAINTAAGADGKILQDLGVTYIGLKGHELSLGQKKIAVTEEGVRSSSELDFAERAQVTRTFSDRRETGLFYKGEYGEHVGALASITNGTASNVVDDSNDTAFLAGRVDIKPAHGLMLGASGGTSGGEGLAHVSRTRYGAHLKYDGDDDLPIGVRVEYLRATDGQAGKADLVRDGFYAALLYTLDKQYQLGVRYDELDKNKDVGGNKVKTFTAGFHYLIKGKNINIKADYYHLEEEGRKINSVLEEGYSQFVLAAQVAF